MKLAKGDARKKRRNPVAALEAFDLEDRAGWERAIRDVGGLRVAREDRPDFAEVPGYLKGYRRGMAPDELAQVVADERHLPVREVERSMLRAFHGPRRRSDPNDDYAAAEREAIQGETPVGEARPRVTVAGDTFKLRPGSPFKGQVSRVNNPAPDPCPHRCPHPRIRRKYRPRGARALQESDPSALENVRAR